MKIALSFLMLFSIGLFPCWAQVAALPYEGLSGCGEYWGAGVVRATKQGYFIVINEKTRSEYNLKSPLLLETKLAPYLNRPIKAKLSITKAMNGTIGEFQKIELISHRVPNPLQPTLDTGFKLIKKMECKK